MDKRRLLLVLLFCTFPVTAHADRHKKGFRLATGYAQRSGLWGGQFSTEFPLDRKRPDCCCEKDTLECCKAPEHACDNGKGAPRTFSAVLDLSFVTGEHEGEHLEQFTYLSGLRYSFNRHRKDDKENRREIFDVYVQALVGGSHDSSADIQDRPQVGFGAGLHVPIKHWLGWGVSFQVDRYALLGGSTEWFTYYSLGIVWRLEKPPGGSGGIGAKPRSSAP